MNMICFRRKKEEQQIMYRRPTEKMFRSCKNIKPSNTIEAIDKLNKKKKVLIMYVIKQFILYNYANFYLIFCLAKSN